MFWCSKNIASCLKWLHDLMSTCTYGGQGKNKIKDEIQHLKDAWFIQCSKALFLEFPCLSS